MRYISIFFMSPLRGDELHTCMSLLNTVSASDPCHEARARLWIVETEVTISDLYSRIADSLPQSQFFMSEISPGWMVYNMNDPCK